MNIIYFTTASDTLEFQSLSKVWKNPINPSNQVFHNKLVRALSRSNTVDVISLRPFSTKLCTVNCLTRKETVADHAIWHYLKVKGGRIRRYVIALFEASLVMKKLHKDSIVVTDTINPSVLSLATHFAKRYKLPIIGVCTDSPSGISGTGRSFTMLLLKKSKNLSGYIALTSSLNELFNEQQKPCLILEGIVENDSPEKIKTNFGKYIFFAGSLMEKYGVMNLINCYKRLEKCGHNLVICGHSGNNALIEESIKSDPRIIFLGNISNSEVMSLEASAWANINPRIYSEDLDRYSIPSKVLEYLNSGVPTISVKNSKLQKVFNNDAIWSKSASPEDLLASVRLLDSLSVEEYKALANNSKEKVKKYYSINAVSDKLNGFLYLFRKDR